MALGKSNAKTNQVKVIGRSNTKKGKSKMRLSILI